MSELPRLTATDLDALAADLIASEDDWIDWSTDDGRDVAVRLRVLPDDIPAMDHINGCDAWGRVEWGRTDRDYYDRHYRPEGFNGAASIIYHDRRERLWWQPPTDIRDVVALERVVRDLIEYGFVGYVVDVRAEIDTPYGPRTVDVASASLWGIDTRDPRDYPSAVADLAAECFHVT